MENPKKIEIMDDFPIETSIFIVDFQVSSLIMRGQLHPWHHHAQNNQPPPKPAVSVGAELEKSENGEIWGRTLDILRNSLQ
jgi:hypothetical protein